MSATAVHEPKPAPPPPRSFTPVARAVVQRKCACGGTPGADGECASCKSKRQLVQRRAADSAAPASAPESVHRTLASPGRPLDTGTRDFMESRFGHDFSQVRVHTDSQAGDSARDINAHAYTAGSDIAFAPGKYQPESQSGRQLIAHELAHTVQQSGLQRRASDLAVDTAPDSRLEHEADRAARSVMHGVDAPIIGSRLPGTIVSRLPNQPTNPAPATTPAPATAAAKIPQKVTTAYMTTDHDVTPEAGTTGVRGSEASYEVDKLFVPESKGLQGYQRYLNTAGGALQTVLTMSGVNVQESGSWQERDNTDELRSTWLKARGLVPGAAADAAWIKAGGQTNFPVCSTGTCQMDHIIELQLHGTGNAENIQPLEGDRNRDSGGSLKYQIWGLASQLAQLLPATARPTQIRLRFKGVVRAPSRLSFVDADTPAVVPGSTAPALKRGTSCISIGQAMTDNLAAGAPGGAGAPTTLPYVLTAGGANATIQVPANLAPNGEVDIYDDSVNRGAGLLISGLLLKKFKKGKAKAPDTVQATLDTTSEAGSGRSTRLPISLPASSAAPISFSVGAQPTGTMKLLTRTPALTFTYPYLSAGSIKSISMNASGGIDWAGKITPTPKFLPTLDVEYKEDTLRLITQVPEEKLKKAKLFGAKITKASLELVLSPNFDVTGNIDFIVGSANNPAAIGNLKLGKDDKGLVGTAKVQLKIPKVDTTEITFEYKGGADREEWSGELKIETAQIKVPYVTSSSIVARVTSKGGKTDFTFDGKVSLELPNKRGTAEVGLKQWGKGWFFAGMARLNIPKIENFSLYLVYDIANETMTASMPGEDGKMPSKPVVFTITEDFKGTLDRLKLKIAKGGVVTVTGAGGFAFKKGKAAGKVSVELLADGSFYGIGSLTYALSENLTVDGKVEFKEKGVPKLRITGSLTFAKIELMKAVADDRTLFDKEFSVPIPFASIGGVVGLKAIFGVKLEASYSLGPIVVEPLTFTAGFNPMDDEPQLNLGASGELKVPVTATLSASLSGGVKLDAYIAEVGGKITITGTIKLKGGLFVPFKGTYSNTEFAVEMTPEARLNLLLGIALSATVWAKAGIGWLSVGTSKTWDLGKREVDTGLGFGIKAPISYSSRTGAKIPSLNQIEFVPPDFSKENLSRVVDRLFGETKGDPPDA